MRPVLLEMAGFGSFREPTTVDFAGADYFALVGPTGAGKSTVIDAMTFALYGSVPRWDNARTVALALAPTVNRGTVAELAALAEQAGEDFLRVWVREPARAGLRDEVQALLPNALEVRIDPEFAAPVAAPRPSSAGPERSPSELFHEYLGTRGVADPRVEQLFARLHDRVTGEL